MNRNELLGEFMIRFFNGRVLAIVIVSTLIILSLNSLTMMGQEELVRAVWTITLKAEVEEPFSYPVVVAWSPDGRYLAVAERYVLRVYEFKSLEPIWETETYEAYPGDLPIIAWSPDGRYIILHYIEGGSDYDHNGIALYSASTGERIYQDDICVTAYTGVGYWGLKVRDFKLLVIDCKEVLYDIAGTKPLKLWAKALGCLTLSIDAKRVLCYAKEKLVTIDADTGNVISSTKILRPPEDVIDLVISPSGKYMAFMSRHEVTLYDNEGKYIAKLRLEEEIVRILWATDDYIIILTRKGVHIFRWDGRNFTHIYGFPTPEGRAVWEISLSPDGKYLAVSVDGEVIVYDISRVLKLTKPPAPTGIVITFTTTETKTVLSTTRYITTLTKTKTVTTTITETLTRTLMTTKERTVTTTIIKEVTRGGYSSEILILIALASLIVGFIIGRKR